MHKLPRHFLLAPGLGLVVLGGAAVNMAMRPRATDALPYHKLVHDAAYAPDGVPEFIGTWTWNRDYVPSDRAAVELLKPNVLIQRQYRNGATNQEMSFLLDQCPDAQTMQGHYPPVCYPNLGMEQTERKAVTLTMKDKAGAGVLIPAVEYIFIDRTRDSQSMIFNFFILPNGQYAEEMWEVDEAAKDYTRRFYGAAQTQFVFKLPRGAKGAELEAIRVENQATVETFLSATSNLLELISKGGRS
jgi:hypothetical protein